MNASWGYWIGNARAALVISAIAAGAWPVYGKWFAVEESSLSGFNAPEAVLPIPAAGVVYVSNAVTATHDLWAKDANGFISKLRMGDPLRMVALQWLGSSRSQTLDAPKGLCLFQHALFVADIDHVVRIGLDAKGNPGDVQNIRVLRARLLKSVATDGKHVYVSDTAAGKIFRLNPHSIVHREIPAPPSITGIVFHRGKMFGVSWETHEIYEIDPTGATAPIPFGLSSHFWSLDGIAVLDDGSFLVSDFKQNKVSIISPDRSRVRTLIRIAGPAGIGLDAEHRRLYVAQVNENTVRVYRLTTKRPPPANILKLEEKKKAAESKKAPAGAAAP